VAIDFADPNQVVVKPVDFDPENAGLVLCIVNTHSSHADLTPDYAAIPQEMFAVAQFFGKKKLQSLNIESVLAHAPEIRKAVGDRALLRSIHFLRKTRELIAWPKP
jgi:galactokinase